MHIIVQEELNAASLKALSDLRTEMSVLYTKFSSNSYLCWYTTVANNFRKQLSSRLKALEKEHERALAERMVKYKNEIEVCKFSNSPDTTHT